MQPIEWRIPAEAALTGGAALARRFQFAMKKIDESANAGNVLPAGRHQRTQWRRVVIVAVFKKWNKLLGGQCGLAQEISKTNNADSGNSKIEQHFSAVRTYRSLDRQQDPLTVHIHWPSRET